MIGKEGAEFFLGKFIQITTEKGWFLKGKIVKLTDNGIILDEIKKGEMLIAYSNIKAIEEWKK